MLCARCQQDNPDAARFCNQCGAPLAAAAAPELKRLTVLFCDLVGSVELAGRLDPEDWHALLAAYQAAAGEAIRRHHGHVAQHLGDGLVAYFGYPLAGEDDAVRAVRAALELVRDVAALPVPGPGRPLEVRVGLHTGAVVMGHVAAGGAEYLAVGDTPNLAARIQALAPAGAVLLSPATRALVEAGVRCVDLGEFALKGVAAPMRLHRALALRDAHGHDGSKHGASPFLGREHELDLLSRRWRESAAAGCSVLLRGEPGIGKSRLAHELRAVVRRAGADSWTLRCSAHGANTPFAPLAQFLNHAMALAGAAQPSADALGRVLEAVGVRDDAVAAPLRALLGVRLPTDPAPSAQALRERTFAAATAVLRTMSAHRHTLILVEDLHWADPSTLEWLERVLAADLPPGLMLLLLARPEFDPEWVRGPRVERMALDACGAQEAAALVTALDPEHALGAEAVARIVERADGNPLFLEEFTRCALEAQGEEIPLTLQEQTMARLDRLGRARQVLQHAAVIGRHFTRRQLRAASGLADAELDDGLKRGIDAHMVRPLDGRGEAFAFRHALLRDAAYASLLRSARQACHARVAQAILAEDPAGARDQPELLAHHYTEAGELPSAIAHWLAAARQALGRSACVEAAAHARTALRLLGDPGDSQAALAQELQLHLVLAPALMAVRGMLDPQVQQAYARARALCLRLGNSPKLLVPLWGLWAYELMRGEIEHARDVAGQLRSLADASGQPVPALVAAATHGMTLFYQGDLQGARAECAKGLGHSRLAPSADGRGFHDPGVMCHVFHTLACWALGEADTAAAGAAAVREMAPALPPFDGVYAWCSDALLNALAGDARGACDSAARAIAMGKEQGFPAWQMIGSIVHGWGRARQGDAAPAMAQMRRGIDAWCASGARNLRPFFLMLQADAWLACGDARQALEASQRGLTENATGERCWDAELHRLQAEALARLGEQAPALENARRAIEIAARMQARAWEQRAHATLERIAPEPTTTTTTT